MQFISLSFHQRIHSECVKVEKSKELWYKISTKEEKEAACAFLSMFLSHDVLLEAAKDDNYHLSVRKDVLEEQINRVNENTNVYVSGFDQFRVGDLLNKELDAQKLYELLEAARPEKYFPKELRNILSEEIGRASCRERV